MQFTSDDVRNATFTGTRYVYDRSEIDAFLEEIADTLLRYEQDVAAARRRMDSLERALASEPVVDSGSESHAEARPTAVSGSEESTWLSAELSSEENGEALAVALEDARLLLQVTEAKAVDREEQLATELAARAAEHRAILEAGRQASLRERDEILAAATADAERLVEEARREGIELMASAEGDVRSTERRVRQIRSALRDLELRFERASSNVAAEFSMLGDLIDLETTDIAELAEPDAENVAAGAFDVPVDDEVRPPGFYERRLAGLRSRLEAQDEDPADDQF